MCGRFTLVARLDDIAAEFGVSDVSVSQGARYNVAPTQDVLVLLDENGERQLAQFRWGLVPHWAKQIDTRYSMINARAETLKEKPAYRRPFASQRCLVLADGFYEWQKTDDGKVPMYIRLKSRRPFGLAGLWDVWQPPEGGAPLRSCTIVTTTPNELLAPIHNRMPVMLPPHAIDTWLGSNGVTPDELQALLKPYAAGELEAYAVSRYVNNPANESPQCIEPVQGGRHAVDR